MQTEHRNKQSEVYTSKNKSVNQSVNSTNTNKNSLSTKNNNDLSTESIWLTIKESVNLLNISKMGLHKRIKAGKYKTKQVKDRGGTQNRIALSSLPQESQHKYFMQIAETEKKKANTANELKDWQQEKALARYQLIKKYNNHVISSRMKSKVKAKKKFVKAYNNEAYPDLYDILGETSFSTVERWRRKLENANYDYTALAPKHGKNKGRNSLSKEHTDILIRLYLSPNKPKVSEVIREARNIFKIRNMQCDASDRTLRRYINDFKKNNYDRTVLMRQGENALNNKALYYIERDYDEIEVGDIVVADGHVLNFDVKHPKTGRPCRATWLVVYDMKTNIPIGWEIMPTENTRCIASAYRHAILNLGFVPRVFYLDNGKAFKSKFFNKSKSLEMMSGLFERLGTETIFAWPYHGQSKTVERFFGTFGEFERKMISYRGNDVSNQPARLQRGEKLHRKWYDNLVDNVPTIFEAEEMIKQWIVDYIDRKTTSDSHLDGKKPVEAYLESVERVKKQNDFEERQIEKEELNYLMLESKKKSLYRNGIRHLGNYYYNSELYRFSKEKGNRAKFNIKYDIHNPDKILVFQDNKFVCTAKKTNPKHPAAEIMGDEKDKQELKQDIAKRRRLKKNTIEQAEKYIEESEDIKFVEDVPQLNEAEQEEIEKQKEQKEQEKEDDLKLVGDDEGVEEEKEDLLLNGLQTKDSSDEEDEIFLFEADKNEA